MLVKIEERNKEDILVVSSREIAEDFEKEHSEILKRIHGYERDGKHINGMLDDFDSSVFTLEYFIPSEYKDLSGKSNKEYMLTRDGFSLLTMGFTGAKALQWKLKYINAFNSMEKELKRLYKERQQWEIEELIHDIYTGSRDSELSKTIINVHGEDKFFTYCKIISSLFDCGWSYDKIKFFIEQTNTKQLAG